jgi:sugar/nucleoside kinase (ribokinase family)
MFGRFMLDEMRKRDVDVANVIVRSDGQTGLSLILNRGADRAILTYPGLIPALRAEEVSDAMLKQARHLHVASYFLQTNLQPGLSELFQRAHTHGLTTSLDTNYDPSEQWNGFDELLSVTDVFFPNKTEALSLSGFPDLEAAARHLADKTKFVVIKLGADGAILQVKNEMTRRQSISVEVVDTIGAGDTFDAGFLYGYLNHWDLKTALQMAAVCGALSTRAVGGTAGQPTLEEAMGFLR